MNINPAQLVALIKSGGNPQRLVINLLEQNMGNNPMFANLLQLAKNGNSQQIEQIARNLVKQQGRDFDTEFTNFKQTLGL